MMNKTYFSTPGQYRVEVHGQLGPEWSDRFGSMQVISPLPGGGDGVTILQGPVSDQAELSGILNTLYELHLSLLSVHRLKDE